MPHFDAGQTQFIKSLGKLTKVFDELSKNNDDLNLIGAAKEKELSDLKAVCESIYTKLHDGKFTVAIVGLENSGKSTLGNTLIGIPDLLPTASLRCTFTITKALAGSTENKGRVSFYTLEEFNGKFAEAVESISTLKANAVDYQNITWAQISPNLLPKADKYAVEDIKNMIDKRNKINNLLNKADRNFTDAELRELNFKQYITGKDPATITGKDPATGDFNGSPYAVKEITIWSTQFKNMSDIVLYDVPGFNSINALHKEQTDDMINEADAVILIMDLLSGAQINAEHLNIFRQGCDKYGTQYRDKVFVFGNKADLLVTSENIPPNKSRDEAAIKSKALTDSVERAGISKGNYIVCGSAFLYDAQIRGATNKLGTELSVLSDLGLTENVEVTDAAGNKTTETMGGVKLLVNKLEEYYRTARYDVLTQRIKNILERVRAFFNGINIEYELNKLNDGGIMYYDAAENLDKFEREAGRVIKEEIAKIKHDHPFSNILGKEKLQEIFPEQDEQSPILSEIIDAQPLDADGLFHVESVDPEFRKRIFQLFLSNIKSEIMKSQRDAIYKELKRVFLQNMGMFQSVSAEDKVELEQSVDKLFNDLCDDQKWAENGFTDLRGELFLLLEVLIKNPFSSSRIAKVFTENNFRRLSSLADYYAKFDPSVQDSIRRQRWTEFFTRILLQQDTGIAEAQGISAVDVLNRLQTFFETTRQQGLLDGLAVNDLPLETWAQKLAERGKNFLEVSGLKADFEECMRETDGWRHKSGDSKKNFLQDAFEDYIGNLNVNPAAVPPAENISPAEINCDQVTKIFASNRTSITTPRDMVNVLNADIRNLRAFISGALINALNIEGGFISLIIKEVDRIRFARNTESGKALIRTWVATYTRKIRAADFDGIESKRIKNERRNTIATAIKDALNELTIHI